jgi:hypothetical protein
LAANDTATFTLVVKAGSSQDLKGVDSIVNQAMVIGDGDTVLTGTNAAGGLCDGCPTTISLPVQLLAFTAQEQSNHTVLLQWTTATEINNKGFSVQRSGDGDNFAAISFVNSLATNGGNSSVPLNYSYTDKSPLSGISYYRLVQTDLDGITHVSKLLQVNLSSTMGAKVYPNPAKTLLNVVVPADVTDVTYKLIDADGKIALKGAVANQNGTIQIPITSVASGIYFLQVTTNNIVHTYEVEVRQ